MYLCLTIVLLWIILRNTDVRIRISRLWLGLYVCCMLILSHTLTYTHCGCRVVICYLCEHKQKHSSIPSSFDKSEMKICFAASLNTPPCFCLLLQVELPCVSACMCLCMFMHITFWMDIVCMCVCVCVYPSVHSLSPSLLPSVPLIPECVTNGRSRCSALLRSAPGDPSSVCVRVCVHVFLSWGV